MAGGKGAKYAEAAHAAAQTVETQGGLLECVVPANNIVREFLLEVRRERLSKAIEHTDQLAGQMKRAADALVTHAFRVWDMPSAQRVKGCGPAMARILADNLWRLYPADPPEEEELEELARQEAALKAAAAAQRKRKKQEAAGAAAAGAGALGAGPSAAAASLPAGLAAAADVAADAAAGGKGRGGSKAAQEYIPQLGSAPYAFLLVMLQAQKGPAKQQHFGKQELIDLAEASGLSTKPINGDGTSKRQTADGRMFKFDGWTSFRTLIKKGLAHEWSNPKKVSLTAQGFALAERLYRKEVARGAVEPIPGIPTDGPLLFQMEEADPSAAAAAAAAMPAGALPSAALNPARQLAPRDAAAAAALRRSDAPAPAPAPSRAAAAAAAPLPDGRLAALYTTGGFGEPALPPAASRAAGAGAARAAAAAAAAATKPSSLYYDDEEDDDEDADLGLSLVERLQRQRQPQPQQAAQQAQPPRQAAQPAHADLLAAAAAAGAAAAALIPPPPAFGAAAAAGTGAGGGGSDVIDLLSDDSPSPIRKRGRHSAAAAAAAPGAAAAAAALAAAMPPPAVALAAFAAVAAPAAGGEAGGQLQAAVPDEQVAAMVEMGYSDRKARRALRRSLGELGLPDIERAVELAELLESEADDSEGEGPAGPAAPWQPPPRQQQQQQAQQQLEPQRGWEQPPAGGERQASGLLLGPNPALLAGAVPSGVAARQPSRPTSAAALQRNDSGRSQQSQPWQPQQPQQGSDVVARGHIRMGSQQQPLEGSQQQEEAEGDGEYNIDRFLSQLDRRLQGGGDAAAASGDNLARSGSGSGSGEGSRTSSYEGGSIRLQAGDLRLPPLPPGRRFGEEYEVLLLIDGREHFTDLKGHNRTSSLQQHLDKMRQAGLAVEDRHLPIGDVLWIARSRRNSQDEYVLDFIVERKSVQDLVGSIKGSSRFERQKYYLRRCGVRTVYYLIEGDPDQLPEQEQKMCRTAAARTEVHDGFKLLRTTDHISTFRLYFVLTQHIQAVYCDCTAPAAGNSAGQLPTFAAWQARCKENGEGTITLHDIWGVMLQGVPKLGPEAIRAILLRYPTPLDLYQAYQAAYAAADARGECGHRAAQRLLRGLKTEGAKAGIGPDKAATVYDSLFKRRMAGGQAVT